MKSTRKIGYKPKATKTHPKQKNDVILYKNEIFDRMFIL